MEGTCHWRGKRQEATAASCRLQVVLGRWRVD